MSPMNSFYFNETNSEEILMIIKSFKNSHCFVEQDIPIFLWKKIAPTIADFLADLVNRSIGLSTFPIPLKKAKLLPIYKNGAKNDVSNYRPIAITHYLGKIIEKTIHSRLIDFFNKYKILSKTQFGFTAGLSTKHAIINLFTTCYAFSKTFKYTAIILLDLSKAFDKICHNTLFRKLFNYGIRGSILSYIKSYFSQRQISTTVESSMSNYLEITCGTPQGTILSPLFYNIYVNDLHLLSGDDRHIIQYADDTSIIIGANSVNNLIEKCETCLSDFEAYFSRLNLSLNVTKTKVIFINTKQQYTIKTPTLSSPIVTSLSARFLGINIDHKLSLNPHTPIMIKNINYYSQYFRTITNYLNHSDRILLFNALIKPTIDYSLPFLNTCNKTNINALDKRITLAAKILFQKHIRTPTALIHSIININALSETIEQANIQFSKNIINSKLPGITLGNYVHLHLNKRTGAFKIPTFNHSPDFVINCLLSYNNRV
jgi:hypothetical protein